MSDPIGIWWTTEPAPQPGDGANRITSAQWQEFGKLGLGSAAYANRGLKYGSLGMYDCVIGAGQVTISTGFAFVDGLPCWNDAVEVVPIATPLGATRIDLITIRKSWSAQTTEIYRIAGTEGSGVAPYASLLQIAGATWDLPIWEVEITTGAVITIRDVRQFNLDTFPQMMVFENNTGAGLNNGEPVRIDLANYPQVIDGGNDPVVVCLLDGLNNGSDGLFQTSGYVHGALTDGTPQAGYFVEYDGANLFTDSGIAYGLTNPSDMTIGTVGLCLTDPDDNDRCNIYLFDPIMQHYVDYIYSNTEPGIVANFGPSTSVGGDTAIALGFRDSDIVFEKGWVFDEATDDTLFTCYVEGTYSVTITDNVTTEKDRRIIAVYVNGSAKIVNQMGVEFDYITHKLTCNGLLELEYGDELTFIVAHASGTLNHTPSNLIIQRIGPKRSS